MPTSPTRSTAGGSAAMSQVAVAILCKTPAPGRSKTRLSPPLRPDECAAISACFIADLAATIAQLARNDPRVRPAAVYTPVGSEAELGALVPDGFAFVPQREGDFGERLGGGVVDLLGAGHTAAIVVNSDSPTLPEAILAEAVEAVLAGDGVVLSPADDGGYVLVGLPRFVPRLFEDIAWSTPEVFRSTLERAAAVALPVRLVPGWYDIDDAASYAVLEAELAGTAPPFARPGMAPAEAAATRRFVAARKESLA